MSEQAVHDALQLWEREHAEHERLKVRMQVLIDKLPEFILEAASALEDMDDKADEDLMEQLRLVIDKHLREINAWMETRLLEMDVEKE